jgi:acetyl esterase
MIEKIGEGGFGKLPGVFEFKPSYLPAGKSTAQVRQALLGAIKAAAPSYGVFDGPLLNHHAESPPADDSWRTAISPLHHIPKASQRAVPQYLMRGTKDPVIPDEMCRGFMEALVNAGQRVEYVQVGGASHAFLDWTPDLARQATFHLVGAQQIAQLKAFFNSVLLR